MSKWPGEVSSLSSSTFHTWSRDGDSPEPRAQKEVLVGCYRRVLDEVMSQYSPEKLVIGGLSMGAAVASHTVADKPGRADIDGLFYFSYPIHRPGEPEEL